MGERVIAAEWGQAGGIQHFVQTVRPDDGEDFYRPVCQPSVGHRDKRRWRFPRWSGRRKCAKCEKHVRQAEQMRRWQDERHEREGTNPDGLPKGTTYVDVPHRRAAELRAPVCVACRGTGKVGGYTCPRCGRG